MALNDENSAVNHLSIIVKPSIAVMCERACFEASSKEAVNMRRCYIMSVRAAKFWGDLLKRVHCMRKSVMKGEIKLARKSNVI